MKRILYRIIYRNKASTESVLTDVGTEDLYVSSIKEQIAKENGIDSGHFRIYAVNTGNSTKIPLENNETLTEDTQILELHEEELQQEANERSAMKRKDSDNSLCFEETSQLLVEKDEEYSQVQPEAPPHILGVFKVSRWLKCFSKTRFFELNPDILVINIYERKAKFPKHPLLTIPLLTINRVTRLNKTPCFSRKSYMRIVAVDIDLTISFDDKSVCSNWIKYIKQAIPYAKFVEAKRSHLHGNWRPKLQELKIELVDDDDGGLTSHRRSGQSQKSTFDVLFSKQHQPVLFEHFEVERKIGNGSFGQVYFARHRESGKEVALKQLNKEMLIHRQQLRYAVTQLTILKEVDNPFIIRLFYAFQTKENLYLGLKYCPNGTLKDLIQDNGGLSVEDTILYTCEIILAIEYLHKRKIIYRDMKPDNILMTEDFHVCLSDFGLSKTHVEKEDYTESFLGTPAYLAPEMVVTGRATFVTDIYGIGAVMYEMLHGKMLYYGSHIGEIMSDIKEIEPEINQNLPKEVKSFLRATLAKDPLKRIKNPMEHPLFRNVNWNGIIAGKVHPRVRVHEQRSNLEWNIGNHQIDEDYCESDYLDKRISDWLYSS